MDLVPTHLLIPLGAVVAALVAGLFSFFNLVLSKEQKISELRQNWVDGLRNDLATFIYTTSLIEYLSRMHEQEAAGGHVDGIRLSEAMREPFKDFSTSYTRIVLRLNPADRIKSHARLLDVLERARRHHSAQEYKAAAACRHDIQEQARQVLGEEWRRVKDGEPTFRWSKRVALVLLLCAAVLGGYLLLGHRQPPVQAGTTPIQTDGR